MAAPDTSIKVRLEDDLKNKLLIMSALENTTVSDIIRQMIKRGISDYELEHGIHEWKVK